MKDKNDAFLIVRIPKALKNQLLARAEKRKKTLSTLIRDILHGKEKAS